MPEIDEIAHVPHRELIFRRMTEEMFLEENLNRELSEELRLLIGDMFLYFGKTEMQIRFFALSFLRGGQTEGKNPFWDKYSVLRHLIKEAKKRDLPVAGNIFKYFGSSGKLVTKFRNMIAHGDVLGTLQNPPDHIRIITFRPDGEWMHHVVAIEDIRWVVFFLKSISEFQGMLRALYEDTLFEDGNTAVGSPPA